MQINFTGDLEKLEQGLVILEEDLSYTQDAEGFSVTFIESEGDLVVEGTDEKATITYEQPVHAFRGLGLLLEQIAKGEKEIRIKETPQFTASGAMLDSSRNGVLKVENVKYLVRKMAVMGLNQLMVYTEDTYEVDELPYFGYMRGRYTKDEIREMDAFAQKLGVEMIPCIQTLAHLSEALKWEYANEIRDTEDILFVGKEETYDFLDKIIRSASEPYTSNRIHIGMDEAHFLGLGRYLDQNDYTHRFELMEYHLKRVKEITDKYGLEPMMWSDMFFTVGSEKNVVYDEDAIFPESLLNNMVDVDLVYWNYYQGEQAGYKKMFNRHHELNKKVIFAGGIWTWNGIVPNYGKTWVASNAGLTAAKETGVTEMFATMWGDNGQETNLMTVLPGLQLYAEHTYHETVTKEQVKERFEFLLGTDIEDFLVLSQLDETPGVSKDNEHASMTSKVLLYQDILIGLFDKNIEGLDLETHYREISERIKQSKENNPKFEALFQFYESLGAILSDKAHIGQKIKAAYDAKDKEKMSEHLTLLEKLLNDLNDLRKAHRTLWLETNKPFGWEILDIRYGGVIARTDTSIARLNTWINDTSVVIEELEAERLPYRGPFGNPEGIIGNALYNQIVSTSPLSK